MTLGPHPKPWPSGPEYDVKLLEEGDTRNVVDKYRYWSREAIIADLDQSRHSFHIAIENWEHDFNIGTVVRNANAFLARGVHIIGKRRWNRRGAMVTDRYQHIHHTQPWKISFNGQTINRAPSLGSITSLVPNRLKRLRCPKTVF